MRYFLALASLHGVLAVALGAFGAHGLAAKLAAVEDGAKRLAWWETAAHYQLTHALALGLVALLLRQLGEGAPVSHGAPLGLRLAGWAFFVGAAIFSGTLYVMTLTGIRWLGAITPIGGSLLIAGWTALVWYGFQTAR